MKPDHRILEEFAQLAFDPPGLGFRGEPGTQCLGGLLSCFLRFDGGFFGLGGFIFGPLAFLVRSPGGFVGGNQRLLARLTHQAGADADQREEAGAYHSDGIVEPEGEVRRKQEVLHSQGADNGDQQRRPESGVPGDSKDDGKKRDIGKANTDQRRHQPTQTETQRQQPE